MYDSHAPSLFPSLLRLSNTTHPADARNHFQKFRFLAKEELPDYADWGTFYRTLSLDPGIYLHHLQSRCLAAGATFHRAAVDHIRDTFAFTAADGGRADVVVNCTGLWASTLGGVMDDKVVPRRGQIVLVENESHGIYFLSGDGTFRQDIGECSYIINRPAGELSSCPSHFFS